jgi:hypothetical protein
MNSITEVWLEPWVTLGAFTGAILMGISFIVRSLGFLVLGYGEWMNRGREIYEVFYVEVSSEEFISVPTQRAFELVCHWTGLLVNRL